MARDLGQSVHIRVVSNREQFQKWWPGFMQSVGKYPIIGMNCKWNGANIVKQMSRMGLNIDTDPHPPTERQKEEWKAGGHPEIEGDTDLDFQPAPNEIHPMKHRESNVRQGKVSLVQLASFGGNVILFRSCFFDKLPTDLMAVLQGRYVKVGQGLEKDRKRLLESFMVTPSTMVDIRHTCLRWPYFTADFDFDRFGIRSIAKWLFGKSYSAVCTTSPYWITQKLEEEQIRAVAEEVQLYVDIFTMVMLRYFGWTLPRSWIKNEAFGQVMYYWSAPLFEKTFLDSKFRATPVKEVAVTSAKRRFNHDFLKIIRDELELGKGTLNLATLWAWPLPYVQSELEKMLTRESGTGLPCSGYPMVAVDLSRILEPEDFEEADENRRDGFRKVNKSLRMVGTWIGKDGEKEEYTIRLTITAVDRETLDGGDGGGPPLDVETAFGDDSEDENGKDAEGDADGVVNEALPRIEAAATHAVPFLAHQFVWNRLKTDTNQKDNENLEEKSENEPEDKTVVQEPAEHDDDNVVEEGAESVERSEEEEEVIETNGENQHRSRYEKFYGREDRKEVSLSPRRGEFRGAIPKQSSSGFGTTKGDLWSKEAEDSEPNECSEVETTGLLSSGRFLSGPKDAGLSFLKPVWNGQEAFMNGEGSYARGNGTNFEFENLGSAGAGGAPLGPESECEESVGSLASTAMEGGRSGGGFRSPRGVWRSGGRSRGWIRGGGGGSGFGGRGTFTNTFGLNKFRGTGGGSLYRGGRSGFDLIIEGGEGGCSQGLREEKRFYEARNARDCRERQQKEYYVEQQSNRYGVSSSRGYSRVRGSGMNVNRNRNESGWGGEGNFYQQPDNRTTYQGNGGVRGSGREYNNYSFGTRTRSARSFTPRKNDIFGHSCRGKNNSQLDQGGGGYLRRGRGSADYRGVFFGNYDRGVAASAPYGGRPYAQSHYSTTTWNRGGGGGFGGGGGYNSGNNSKVENGGSVKGGFDMVSGSVFSGPTNGRKDERAGGFQATYENRGWAKKW